MTTPNVRQFLRMRMMPPQTIFTKRMAMSSVDPGQRDLETVRPPRTGTIESKYFRCTSSRLMFHLADGAEPGQQKQEREHDHSEPERRKERKQARRKRAHQMPSDGVSGAFIRDRFVSRSGEPTTTGKDTPSWCAARRGRRQNLAIPLRPVQQGRSSSQSPVPLGRDADGADGAASLALGRRRRRPSNCRSCR